MTWQRGQSAKPCEAGGLLLSVQGILKESDGAIKETQKQGKLAEHRAKFRENHVGSDLPVPPNLVQRFQDASLGGKMSGARHCFLPPVLHSRFHSNIIDLEGFLKLIYCSLPSASSAQPLPLREDASFFILLWKWSYFYTYLVLKCNSLS